MWSVCGFCGWAGSVGVRSGGVAVCPCAGVADAGACRLCCGSCGVGAGVDAGAGSSVACLSVVCAGTDASVLAEVVVVGVSLSVLRSVQCGHGVALIGR